MASLKLDRRTLLRGIGGAAIGLPLLECMLDKKAFAQSVIPRRYGIVFAGQSIGGDGWAKDAQQIRVIRRLVRDLNFPVQIIEGPTVREPDGLAMSSRNRRLSPEDRETAAEFPHILKTAPDVAQAKKQLEQEGFAVDYVQEWRGRRLGAVRLNNLRLIDNL